MDRGDWQAIVHGVARVKHDFMTKLPPQIRKGHFKDAENVSDFT